ncbi:MAG: hypothetical protein KDD02_03620 [Phaeodactylibacter sp.]|nr:hypothetical protein [Phaeodactylibacter sp.]MCB9302563.1 hypothetical protein [Lewinellaceae bacterium]
MRNWLLWIAVYGLAGLGFMQAQDWGAYAGATAYISEANGANVPSAGMEAGVSRGRIHLGVYGMKTLKPAQTPTYESTLEEYGFWASYYYPATPGLSLTFGLRAGQGTAGMEAVHNHISEGLQEEAIRAFSPEIGVEFPLSRHLSAAFISGYRWIWGAENLEDVGCSSYSSLYTGLSLRLGIFPGR